jgi:prepilin-type N-terminal cleavage/methylation domain-containing protein
MTKTKLPSRGTLDLAGARGFSLVELMVAVGVFLVISGAAFTLFNYQQTMLMRQEGLSGLNIGVRNALTQIQLDGVNAANGLVLGAYAPAWPVGATIVNQNPATACNTGSPNFQFSSTCFDELILILADRNTPTCNLAGTGTINLSSATSITVTPTTGTASTYASNFKTGDELMVVSAAGQPFTTITLTSGGTVSGSNIQLSFTSTSSAGINPKDTPGPPTGTGLLLTTDALSTYLGATYNAGTDWVIRLAPVSYYVNVTNPNDPQLMRLVAGGTAAEVMDQVVLFKVGASLVNDGTGNYYYNASDSTASYQKGGYNNDFTLVRSIRVSMMARTTPNGSLAYRNQFDGGPYQVLGASVVINPRNLSMNDQ